MRISFAIVFILVLSSCTKSIENTSDLIDANLKATTKHGDWNNALGIKSEFNLKTIIGDNTTSDVEKIKSIQMPFQQKTETFTNDTLSGIIITEKDKTFTIKFENGAFFGINETPKESVSLNPIVKLSENKDDLIFKDTIWQDKPVYKLIQTKPFEEYVFDQQTKYLIALITDNRYGKSTVTYSDYREVDGYMFPFKEELNIPEAGYGLDFTYSNIEINPKFDSDFFNLDDSWVSVGKGQQLPNFQLPMAMDKNAMVTNGDLKGKVTLMDFWATWCKPCLEEFPNIKKVYSGYKDKGFEVVSISIDKDTTRLKNFLSKKPFPWRLSLYSEGEFKSDLAKRFQLVTLPKPILIDENGKIIAIDEDIRNNNLELLINKFLNDGV